MKTVRIQSRHQGPNVLHHSSTKAKLKVGAGNGLFRFRLPFFGYFLCVLNARW